MTKKEILEQAKEAFGVVPDWLGDMPEAVLDQYWSTLNWVMADTKMAARDKVLVAYGAASAIHCTY